MSPHLLRGALRHTRPLETPAAQAAAEQRRQDRLTWLTLLAVLLPGVLYLCLVPPGPPGLTA